MVNVPVIELEVVKVATPLTSGSLPSVPPWSLKVTVPPVGVAPPADRSLTVAVNVTGWPVTADPVEAVSAVRVGRALDEPTVTVTASATSRIGCCRRRR